MHSKLLDALTVKEKRGKLTVIVWFLIVAVQFSYLEWSAAEKSISDSDCFTCFAGICIRWLSMIMSMMPDPRTGMAVMSSPRRTYSGVVEAWYEVKMDLFPVSVSGTVPVS